MATFFDVGVLRFEADSIMQNGANTTIYGYTFALDSTKTVESVTLPENPGVVILAMTQVTTADAFDHVGIYNDGATFSAAGGLNGGGYAFSAALLGTSLTWDNLTDALSAAPARLMPVGE